MLKKPTLLLLIILSFSNACRKQDEINQEDQLAPPRKLSITPEEQGYLNVLNSDSGIVYQWNHPAPSVNIWEIVVLAENDLGSHVAVGDEIIKRTETGGVVDFKITDYSAWLRFKENYVAYAQAADYFRYKSDPDPGDTNPNAPIRISILKVPPGEDIPPDLWGLVRTEPEMGISLNVVKEGTVWRAVVKSITGRYSVQVRLLPGVSEVTGIGGNTTEGNFCNQVTNLNRVGGSAQNWYMIGAIQAHEDVHVAGLLPTLKLAAPNIEAALESYTVPNKGQSSSTALAQIKVLASTYKSNEWATTFENQVKIDHASGGATENAERRIVEPMISSICNHAKAQTPLWAVCAVCN